MGRKNRTKKKQDPGQSQDFQVNPFAQLGDLVPKESLPNPQAPKPKPKAEPKTALDREDQQLLRAFGGDGQSLQFDSSKPVRRGPAVSLSVQRKGKGGKTVTRIHGLGELDLVARMELAKELGRSLGTNARFQEEVMELQGDQRERATEWLSERGFRTRST
jgi:translation initiation factor 1 (eIF-1/SUI1)